ncbi:MAG: hypothetical protein COZ07_07955 [Candidatus Infernicultor aquiphilus]|uniref:Uncharacterized protein n=2 Tax=Candidatus Infernicultor aquiphilus TaxID=1805029 RepID=A0A1J5GQF5_9BACT|nr:MAG: hypothetical protein AUK42_02990 [Candidatus Atribacteria bacterium CG2_30_33_13]PIU25816.1 MAG: hypothetical protein COT11_00790 [Candidatus Atribacteria bacterium CG08_land_8_20_14_0_20_33_29]PIY31818.1 MAG: hypothetical protein COZ07_07955 [Candidatus Atribacteria bacterium CG_4_10_14_3_um_filter_34_13]PJB57355.1 MAG: hypothetical protein CO097_02615 [Candidatus Atribacteria bacterium CG_4_9_14_3_um_filter_33_16]
MQLLSFSIFILVYYTKVKCCICNLSLSCPHYLWTINLKNKNTKLPLVLNKEEVEKILNLVHNIKHKAILGVNKISESSKKKGDV